MKEKIRIVHHSCLIQTNYVESQNREGPHCVLIYQHRLFLGIAICTT